MTHSLSLRAAIIAACISFAASDAPAQQPWPPRTDTGAAAAAPAYGYTAPYAGRVNHAHLRTHHGQAFRWGWFGAEHFYPSTRWHRGYNGEHLHWSRYRRY